MADQFSGNNALRVHRRRSRLVKAIVAMSLPFAGLLASLVRGEVLGLGTHGWTSLCALTLVFGLPLLSSLKGPMTCRWCGVNIKMPEKVTSCPHCGQDLG